jgi:hypothetical protein
MPRSSSFSGRKVSASSISKVGHFNSMTRKIADALAFAVGRGRDTRRESTSKAVVLPQRFSGDVIASRGEMPKQSTRKV